MKVIVTGSRGFIGQNLIDKIKNKWDIIELDLKIDKDLFKFNEYSSADVVIHLAALASVQESFNKPTETMNINVAGTQHILNNKPKHLIFASSGSVSDPISPYASSKLAAESLIHLSDTPSTILRFGNVYGKGDDKSAIYHFTKNETITINGDGSQRRAFIHVDDIVDAIVTQVEQRDTDTYALGHEDYSILEVAEMFNKPIKFGRKVTETHTYPIEFGPMPGLSFKRSLKSYIEGGL